MLKREYSHLVTKEAVDNDPKLNPEQKLMLNCFVGHLDFVRCEPSPGDKEVLRAWYCRGMYVC